jgi:hypothetical protein
MKDLTFVNASLHDIWQSSVAGKLQAMEKEILELSQKATTVAPPPLRSVKIGDSYYGFFSAAATFENAERQCRESGYSRLVEFKHKEQFDQVRMEQVG